VQLIPLETEQVIRRTGEYRRREVPLGCIGVAVGIDVANRELHWCAMAVTRTGYHVIEYGEKKTEVKKVGAAAAIVGLPVPTVTVQPVRPSGNRAALALVAV
jgi:hypothetical protein